MCESSVGEDVEHFFGDVGNLRGIGRYWRMR